MKRGLYLTGLCLAVGLATVGCGGSTNNGTGVTNSPYLGSYVGSFAYSNGVTGTGVYAINIASNGTVTGRGVNTDFPASQTLSGNVYNTQQIVLNNNGTAGNITYSGILNLTTPGNILTGTVTATGGNTTQISIHTPMIPTGTFSGSYQGSFTNASNQNNNLTIIIDANDVVTGVDDNTSTSTFSTFTGSVLSNGTVSLTSYTSSLGTSTNLGVNTGTFTLANGTLTSALSGAGPLPASATLKQDVQQ
jgi:hypothetical protein